MDVSDYSAASAAGAVFGSLTFLARAVTGIIALIGRDKDSTVFGKFERVSPEPIRITEDEYQALVESQVRLTVTLVNIYQATVKWVVAYQACCCCCCTPCLSKEEREMAREHRDLVRLRELSDDPEDRVAHRKLIEHLHKKWEDQARGEPARGEPARGERSGRWNPNQRYPDRP